MAFKNIFEEVTWLTADAGARKAVQYLDQLKAQIDDCCSPEGLRKKGELAELATSLTEQKSELMKLAGSLQAKLQEQNTLNKELAVLRDELTTALGALRKPAQPEG